jgi:hypothetical protein
MLTLARNRLRGRKQEDKIDITGKNVTPLPIDSHSCLQNIMNECMLFENVLLDLTSVSSILAVTAPLTSAKSFSNIFTNSSILNTAKDVSSKSNPPTLY